MKAQKYIQGNEILYNGIISIVECAKWIKSKAKMSQSIRLILALLFFKYICNIMINDGIYTISQYIESKPNLLLKIAAINALIDAMELKLLDSIGSSNYDEYQMDDGQMKVRTKYTSVADVSAGILSLEQQKQKYVNRHNGRTTIFRGGKLLY